MDVQFPIYIIFPYSAVHSYNVVLLYIFISIAYYIGTFPIFQTGRVLCMDGNFSLVRRKTKCVQTGPPVANRFYDRCLLSQPAVDKFVSEYNIPLAERGVGSKYFLTSQL